MMRASHLVEGQPFTVHAGVVAVPVIRYASTADGWHTADPVALIVATASGTSRLAILGPDVGQDGSSSEDAYPDELLSDRERQALTNAVCPGEEAPPLQRALWHAAWREGPDATPIRTLVVAHLAWDGAKLDVTPAAHSPLVCPCPRHNPPA